MSEIKSRADLFEVAAKMMRMCDEAGVEYAFKYKELLHNFVPAFSGEFQHYEFPLAIVEGKPVFKGDELYDEDGDKQIAPWVYCPVRKIKFPMEFPANHSWSWFPPKTCTVMVELPREDAEWYERNNWYVEVQIRISEACRKALEEK